MPTAEWYKAGGKVFCLVMGSQACCGFSFRCVAFFLLGSVASGIRSFQVLTNVIGWVIAAFTSPPTVLEAILDVPGVRSVSRCRRKERFFWVCRITVQW